jgi:Flp pilus assembly protein protease CpaA
MCFLCLRQLKCRRVAVAFVVVVVVVVVVVIVVASHSVRAVLKILGYEFGKA